jgi:predicted enzyme related to lactoylglutathione lyase
MSDSQTPEPGSIVWMDLTVPDAAAIKDFYSAVTGWTAAPHDMGEYHDFDIRLPGSGKPVTGICYARGPNPNLPAQWLIYIAVEDVDASIARCTALGGKVLDGPRLMGTSRYCVIRDPAGAVAALFQA